MVNVLVDAIADVQIDLNRHLMGINAVRESAFYRITPAISYSPFTGSSEVQIHKSYDSVTDSEFESCYQFVVESALAAATLCRI
jgi:hypothetical protein